MTVTVFSTWSRLLRRVLSLALGTGLAITEGLSVATPEKANSKSEIPNNMKQHSAVSNQQLAND